METAIWEQAIFEYTEFKSYYVVWKRIYCVLKCYRYFSLNRTM